MSLPVRDPMGLLRNATRARVGLGRAGDALPTARLLELSAAHAAARDAVHAPLDPTLLDFGDHPRIAVASAAPDRPTYLQRPDLGRRLAPGTDLSADAGKYDVCFVMADGLSPLAVHRHAASMWRAAMDRLVGWSVAPVVVATQARVALGDEVAVALHAKAVVVLVGERPGMSSTDSLGAYFTFNPRIGIRDSARNCISNIRPPHGVDYDSAATTLVMLMNEARRLGLSGVSLKGDAALLPGSA